MDGREGLSVHEAQKMDMWTATFIHFIVIRILKLKDIRMSGSGIVIQRVLLPPGSRLL